MLHINVVDAVLTEVENRVNNAAIKLSGRSRDAIPKLEASTWDWDAEHLWLEALYCWRKLMKSIMFNASTCQRLAALCRSPHHRPFHLLRPVNASRSRDCRTYAASAENLPRVAQPSIWHSIIPKAFRSPGNSRVPAKPQRTKEWNPATFFICIFLLIGSNAIQMLTLKNEYSTFSRKSDAKIKLLKDVLDRVQRGENVDVEKALGTGDEQQEQEWRDVISNIEEEDRMWEAKDRRKAKKQPQEEDKTEVDGAEKVGEQGATGDMDSGNVKATSNVAKRSPVFY